MTRQFFSCALDSCQMGLQFCEEVSERCRDCKDFIDQCFIQNKHIVNCTTFCRDIMMKNATEQAKMQCKKSGFSYLSEMDHFTIETVLCVALVGCIVLLVLCKIQLISDLIRRLCNNTKGNEEQTIFHSTEPLLPTVIVEKEVPKTDVVEAACMVTLAKRSANCGFTQHNQIPNVATEKASLCLSGSKMDPETT